MDETTGNGELQDDGVLATLSWGMRSHVGPARVENEDFAGIFAPSVADDARHRPPLFVIADGMGGHAAGEVASRLAVEVVIDRWETVPLVSSAKSLRSAIREANLAVIAAADAPHRRGMGTTLTALTLSGHEACVANVGDSRAYLVRKESCTQVTTDHSRVGDMLRMRLITAEQAANHPGRSQLTRSLGGEPVVQIDMHRCRIKRGDTWVLCTDGLWDVVGSRDIAEVASLVGIDPRTPNPGDVAQRLVEIAVERNTLDNVTVVVVQVESERPIAIGARRSMFRRGS